MKDSEPWKLFFSDWYIVHEWLFFVKAHTRKLLVLFCSTSKYTCEHLFRRQFHSLIFDRKCSWIFFFIQFHSITYKYNTHKWTSQNSNSTDYFCASLSSTNFPIPISLLWLFFPWFCSDVFQSGKLTYVLLLQ